MKRTLTVGGIDPSSKRIAIVESLRSKQSRPFLHSMFMTADRIEDQQLEAFDFIVDFAMKVRERDGQSPRLYLEKPVMGIGGPGATIPQAFVSGSIMAAAAQTECYISLVNNQTWKKDVLGSGGLNKEKVTLQMFETWPELMKKIPLATSGTYKGKPDQDLVDAGAINLFGWQQSLLIERIMKKRAK